MSIIKVKAVSRKIQNAFHAIALPDQTKIGFYALERDPAWKQIAKDLGVDPKDRSEVDALLRPTKEGSGGAYEYNFVVTVLPSGSTFDTSDPMDHLKYLALKYNPYFSTPEKKNVYGIHYIFIDEEQQAVNITKNSETMARAFSVVENMTSVQHRRFARFFSRNTDDLSETQIKAMLYETCQKDPQQIVNYANSPELDNLMLMNDLLEKNWLAKEHNIYRYGEIIIGGSVNEVVDWLKNKSNDGTVQYLKEKIGWVSKTDNPGVGKRSKVEDK